MFTYSHLRKLFFCLLLLILLIIVHIFSRVLLKTEGFKNADDISKLRVYNQSGWSIMPPQTWKLPQAKLPLCVSKTKNKSSSVATSGYPIDSMTWQKKMKTVSNPYVKDNNQYAPGIYVMRKNPKYPIFKSNI